MLDLLPAPVYFIGGLATGLLVVALVTSYFRAKSLERETEKFWDL